MFRTAPAAAVEPPRDESSHLEPLVPLSVLALDLPQPAEGWAGFLGRRAIAFLPDDLGRDCVRRQDARRLLDEQHANELRAAKLRQLAEQGAVEADQLRRSQIWAGVPAHTLPVGVSAAAAMLQTAKDAQPRRRSMLEESLAGETLTFHTLTRTAKSD
jgi:hypothetical protein